MKTAPKPITLAELGERAWLRRVARWFAFDAKGLSLGIGDDAAGIHVPSGRGPLLVSTDALVEGVHFRREWLSPRQLGGRALAVNLSDLAAMGARPAAAFLALSVPPQTRLTDLRDFFLGLRAEGRRWACPLAGGDLTRAEAWTLTITVLGFPAYRGKAIRRSSARPGQWLYVTGWPGEAGAGREALGRNLPAPSLLRRFRLPTPRLPEAAVLARVCPGLAMIDVSDGIWNDAGQLAEASGVRVELCKPSLPISPALARLAREAGLDPLRFVLFGGEDYELLFATGTPLATLCRAFERAGLTTPIHQIGRVVQGRGIALTDASGRAIRVTDQTFRHF